MTSGVAAVGFLTGMLIPSTRVENEKVGEIADRVKHQASEIGHEALERGKEVAQEAKDAAVERPFASEVARRQGSSRPIWDSEDAPTQVSGSGDQPREELAGQAG
jgi:hypothetical protein